MGEEFLNQDEIDALLSGGDAPPGQLTKSESEALSEVAGIVAGAAGNVVGMLAGRGVTASVVAREEMPQESMRSKVASNRVFAYTMTWDGADSAPAQLITSERGALALADLMMGGDAKELPEEANDLYLSASQEGLSQLIGSALTNLSGLLGGARLAAGNTNSALNDADGWLPFADKAPEDTIWVAQIALDVEGVEPFDLDLVLPIAEAKNLGSKIAGFMTAEEEQAAAPVAAAPAPAASAPRAAPPRPQAPTAAPAPPLAMPPRPQMPPVDVQPAEFAPFPGSDMSANMGSIDLIVDIPVRVTVELGRTRKMIGEVLALGPGSVVELNKMAGEPVDVLVNGKLIARGEVVVIDESFGVRVTEVVSRAERIRSMGV